MPQQTEVENLQTEADSGVKPTCFVIMPISDPEGYESGHFNRVYRSLIRPACVAAGYSVIRADEVKSANYIILDVLKRVVESDMILCDLSGKNANVMFELGIRQAFDMPVVLVKDERTNRVFDIQGMRTVDYSSSLRIDKVEDERKVITKAIQETRAKAEGDVNSLVSLLSISPAKLENKRELDQNTTVLLNAVEALGRRMSSLENPRHLTNPIHTTFPFTIESDTMVLPDGATVNMGDEIYLSGRSMGRFHGSNDHYTFVIKDNQITAYTDDEIEHFTVVPF